MRYVILHRTYSNGTSHNTGTVRTAHLMVIAQNKKLGQNLRSVRVETALISVGGSR